MYLRQTANDLTGEHSCVMLKALSQQNVSEEYGTPDPKANWIGAFYKGDVLKLVGYLLSVCEFNARVCC